ncbi:MAG: hypothetical protein JNJ88_12950 [Planctomycetes bacterium]|nr:hypothetical protein [Planctomycetota bacterium]
MKDSSTGHASDDSGVRLWAAAARGAQPPSERVGLRDELMRGFDAEFATRVPHFRSARKLYYLAAGSAAALLLAWGALQLPTNSGTTKTGSESEDVALEAAERAARQAIVQARLEALGATLEALAKAPAVAPVPGTGDHATKTKITYPLIEAAAEAAAVSPSLLTQLAAARRIEEIDRQEAAARYRKILTSGSDGAVEQVAQERLRSLFP